MRLGAPIAVVLAGIGAAATLGVLALIMFAVGLMHDGSALVQSGVLAAAASLMLFRAKSPKKDSPTK